jgi:LacI family transcriptional regulator
MIRTARPTIADVAKKAGISTATVSRVLNRTGPVSAESVERVRKAVETLNYIPHAAARTLASHKTGAIGLLLPEISGAFFQPLLRGIETGASEAGYDLLIHTTLTPHLGSPSERKLAEHNTDGLLVYPDSLDALELRRLYTVGFPTVLLQQTPPRDVYLPVVTIENQSGAQVIVEHLIEMHRRRRIVFLQGPERNEDSEWREKGYHEALRLHNVPFDPALVTRGDFNRIVARAAMEKLIIDGVQFEAVFASDDESAVGTLLAIREAGLRVPEDVAVVGFDDQIFAASLIPALTTVRAPTEQVGQQAVQQLVHMIRGEGVEPCLILPTELVLRESCGCP